MALHPPLSVGCVPHEVQLDVDQRTKEIIERGEREIARRRETRARSERPAERPEASHRASSQEPGEQGRRVRDRAHRTSTGTTEGAPGAPRSGSA